MTVDELMEKVEKRQVADPEWNPGKGGPTTLEATCWFVACHEARVAIMDFELTDFAELIMEGQPLFGPLKTRDDLQKWVENIEEGTSEEDRVWDWLDEALDRHFGVRATDIG